MLEKCQKNKYGAHLLSVCQKKYIIDLDGVCFDFVGAFSRWIKRKLNIQYEDSQITDYYWFKCIDGLSSEDFWTEFHAWGRSGAYRDLELLPGAREGVIYLLENASAVHFVTQRPEYARSDTYAALSKYFPIEECQLIFSTCRNGKSTDVNNLNADVIIEDAPQNVEKLAEHTNAHIYLMDATYNKNISHDKIVRVENWHDIIRLEK